MGIPTDPQLRKVTLDALDHILNYEAPNTNFGLCYNLDTLLSDAGVEGWLRRTSDLVAELAEGWPLHSGDDGYPVPHPDKDTHEAYYTTPNLWAGEYGANRVALTQYVRDRLAELIDKENV